MLLLSSVPRLEFYLMFDTFKKRVLGKIKGSVHISDCLYLLTKLYTCEAKLKNKDAVHHQCIVMHRDNRIELNR